MTTTPDPMNVVFAGLGGQGVLKAAEILARAAGLAGYDVKKSELHGMSQRGGSVTSDVRFGAKVLSPMVPLAQAHFLVALDPTQVDPNRIYIGQQTTVLTPAPIDPAGLPSRQSLNTAMLGLLSRHLPIAESVWRQVVEQAFGSAHAAANMTAFSLGRSVPDAR